MSNSVVKAVSTESLRSDIWGGLVVGGRICVPYIYCLGHHRLVHLAHAFSLYLV